MKTVLCGGVFDILHLGHIRHLQEAKTFGDWLVVSLVKDEHVNKGVGRPQFSTGQRREALLALESVDEVILSETGTAIENIMEIRPAVFVKGPDYRGSNQEWLLKEMAAIKQVGGEFRLTTSEKWSSTDLLRSVRLPDPTLLYLENARRRGFLGQIEEAFKKADKMKILFLGETIIDEYRFVRPLAKPSKEFILATNLRNVEKFNGGVIAASRHADWPNATVVTGNKPVQKSRYIDADFSRKLFEVYSDMEAPSLDVEMLADEVKLSDICIVIDFGHGFIPDSAIPCLRDCEFLAVTTQSNAGNWGFNLIGKYRAIEPDYVCIDEQEARLAAGLPYCEPGDLIKQLPIKAKYCTITKGRYGSVSANGGHDNCRVPALTQSGCDTMGAGDCFLAVTAPLLAVGLDLEIATFVGNVAGGMKTAILGHSQHVSRRDLMQNLQWLLK